MKRRSLPLGVDKRDLMLCLIFALCCAWCGNAFLNANAITRVGLSHAIATRGELTIDAVAPRTIDKARYGNHYYCDKAPGLSLLCTPAVAVADAFATMLKLPRDLLDPADPDTFGLRYAMAAYACFLGSIVSLSTAGLFAFRRSLFAAGVDDKITAVMTLALAFGSPYFIWSTAIFGHAPAAACMIMGFSLAWLGKGPGTALSKRKFTLAGLFLSLAMLIDLTAAPPGVFIALYLLALRSEAGPAGILKSGTAMLIGAIPAGLALITYNMLAYGDPLHIGYASVVGWEGMKVGLFGVSAPTWEAFYGITVSPYRGLAWVSPVAFMALAGTIMPWRREHRATALLALAIAGYYLLLNSGYQYWDGGFSLGPRHLTPAVPFLLFALALRLTGTKGAWRRIAMALAALSIVITLIAVPIAVAVPDDGQAMLTGHILPLLLASDSSLGLAWVGVPFLLLVTVPWLLFAAAALVVRPQRSSRL
jgi:hypothetical protein